jgi:hypothetical protein
MNPAINVLVTAPADVAMRKTPFRPVDHETSRFFFRIEFLLLTTGNIMDTWTSVPYIWRGRGAIVWSRRRATGVFTLLPAILNYFCVVF